MSLGGRSETPCMNTLRPILQARRVAAVALAVAIVPFAASTASAAPKHRAPQGKHATSTTAAAPAAAATTTAAAPAVTSVIAIGGYVFYNVSYAEAVDLWLAAVAAAPAGYTPPPVTSVSVDTTVSGTVVDPGH
jgi:hypothetical protein